MWLPLHQPVPRGVGTAGDKGVGELGSVEQSEGDNLGGLAIHGGDCRAYEELRKKSRITKF